MIVINSRGQEVSMTSAQKKKLQRFLDSKQNVCFVKILGDLLIYFTNNTQRRGIVIDTKGNYISSLIYDSNGWLKSTIHLSLKTKRKADD